MKLTGPQQRVLNAIKERGFVECKTTFGGSQSNGPCWRMVEMGLIRFGFGPENSFLQTQGFMPLKGENA